MDEQIYAICFKFPNSKFTMGIFYLNYIFISKLEYYIKISFVIFKKVDLAVLN